MRVQICLHLRGDPQHYCPKLLILRDAFLSRVWQLLQLQLLNIGFDDSYWGTVTIYNDLEPVALGRAVSGTISTSIGWVTAIIWDVFAFVACIALLALNPSTLLGGGGVRVPTHKVVLRLGHTLLGAIWATPKAAPNVHHLDSAIRAPVLHMVGNTCTSRPHWLAVTPAHDLNFEAIPDHQCPCGCHLACASPVVAHVSHTGRPVLRATLPITVPHIHLLHYAVVHFDEAVLGLHMAV
mmetsp:Transcript_81006/g.135530  ORF Transcript_81006/g.135530 Transcript_81006/m.135530 type:complete len:238 (-) Transcript_81006:752-1465(-)